jgi:ATP-dependent DNA helicase 2 subunit 1
LFGWFISRGRSSLHSPRSSCTVTGLPLLPSQCRYAFTYGDIKVPFEKEEIAAIKFDGKSGVTLLGFKPIKKLKIWHNLSHSSFLFPDESKMKGSTVAFAALLAKMIEKEVFAVAKYSPRVNSTPRLVALLPQEEVSSSFDFVFTCYLIFSFFLF